MTSGLSPLSSRIPTFRQSLQSRSYVVEAARFGPRGVDAYRRYEKEADALLSRYGYHVERVLEPDSVSGFPFTPDVVKVAYFEEADGMQKAHADPAHHAIESELYPAAVQQSVWVLGRVRP